MTAMGSTGVSVVIPTEGTDHGAELRLAMDAVQQFLERTGLTFEILPAAGEYGPALRKAAAEAKGRVVVVIDGPLPYGVSAIGDAVALVESGATDVVFASVRAGDDPRHALLRSMLVPILPDPSIGLKAFSASAARLVIAESKLTGGACDLELAFLANKYGFRAEKLVVQTSAPPARRAFGALSLLAAFRIRMTNRNMGYRAARRCPVCFSSEVWTRAQIRGNVVRSCNRCKCRYLNQFAEEDDTLRVRRVLRAHPPVETQPEEITAEPAREKSCQRRLAALRKQLTPRARLLEIGVRDGSFGQAASAEYEYVGIDPVATAARHARARGLDVYCATLAAFVNTGPAFDAITLDHVFENMADPHDALGRMKELLKPGGVLLMNTFDTEGLIYLMTEGKRMTQNFRTHLILFSRSALIELLEHSGFEIASIGADFEYRDHRFLRHWIDNHWNVLAPIARAVLRVLPDPLLVSSGSLRIIARRRAGPPVNTRAIRSVEPTHAR
jgi:2-polyprenyl-3-methyl-5-hydroxy-6-metoxy-1,4-benzoquinol methylase